jgi:NAD(P)-dependent dehydrogenase (short-subunit alcohol dehydrogenase family)
MSYTTQRIALVTGAGSGIGKEVANRFESDGWKVYRSDISIVEGPLSKRCDVSSESDWASLAEVIEKECGRLDVLVNDAGVVSEALLSDTTLEIWNRIISVNLTGTFLGCRTMLPLLLRGNFPAILNVSSVDALRGSRRHTAYAASKGGIVAMTRALALELSSDGIRVNAVCPGTVDTPMVHQVISSPDFDNRDLLGKHPLGRLSTPEDQAAAIAFLCGVDSTFITGVALSVDGGRAIR